MRLDEYLYKKGYFDSRTKAKQSIENGEISINERFIDKSSFFVNEEDVLVVKRTYSSDFVSLGGFKLEKALRDFNFTVKGSVCVDVGASTGGFTDCLLQNGAKKVYSVDLNDGLLHNKLKNDVRVVPIIKNARNLLYSDFEDRIDFLCADLSFISETLVLPIFNSILSNNGKCIILVKPQFELLEKTKNKNGIIRQEKDRVCACRRIYESAINHGFSVLDLTVAPIRKDKNVEFLLLLEKGGANSTDFDTLYKNLKF